MRVRLLVEGVPTNDGSCIALGATSWDDEPYMVVEFGGDPDPRLIGEFTDVRREDDGSITCETTVQGTITPYAGPAEADFDTLGVWVVRRLHLRGGNRVSDPTLWPWPNHPQREGKASS